VRLGLLPGAYCNRALWAIWTMVRAYELVFILRVANDTLFDLYAGIH